MSAKAVNVNDIIDRAKFSGFHFQVVAWCLLIILFCRISTIIMQSKPCRQYLLHSKFFGV